MLFRSIDLGTVHYPFVIKPRWGMGSLAIYKANNNDELRVLYNKSRNEALQTYLKHESAYDSEHCILIQEYLEGDEFGIDIFNDLNSEFLTCIPKLKISMRAGETDIAQIINNANLIDLGRNISEKLKHIGNLDVDIIIKNEKHYIVDMNCRFGGQYPFCHLGGANFLKVISDLLSTGSFDPDDLIVEYGIVAVKDIEPRLFTSS